MKKRHILIVLTLIALCLSCALAESPDPYVPEDGWIYAGYIYGGVAFAVPGDYAAFDIPEDDAANGVVILGGNEDFTLQMRVFPPEVLDYGTFRAMIEAERTAEVSTRMDDGSEITVYRNTRPSAWSELYGIALTGLDGLLYKISIFTGVDEEYGEDAPVWEIARTIGQTARHQDFSEWGVENAPSFP